jgi:hypothetical protein
MPRGTVILGFFATRNLSSAKKSELKMELRLGFVPAAALFFGCMSPPSASRNSSKAQQECFDSLP